MISTFMGEIAKKTIWRRVFFGTQNTVPYCQKYTPTDCFFGYFAHWDIIGNIDNSAQMFSKILI